MGVILPLPPSANHYTGYRAVPIYKHGVGVYDKGGKPKYMVRAFTTHKGRAWMEAASLLLRGRMEPVEPKVRVGVEIVAGIDLRRDLDNVIKPVLDALQRAKVLPDDRYVDRIEARRDVGVDGVRVTLSQIGG